MLTPVKEIPAFQGEDSALGPQVSAAETRTTRIGAGSTLFTIVKTAGALVFCDLLRHYGIARLRRTGRSWLNE